MCSVITLMLSPASNVDALIGPFFQIPADIPPVLGACVSLTFVQPVLAVHPA